MLALSLLYPIELLGKSAQNFKDAYKQSSWFHCDGLHSSNRNNFKISVSKCFLVIFDECFCLESVFELELEKVGCF